MLLTLCWPLMVWLSLTHSAWRWLVPLVSILFLLRLLTLWRQHAASVLPGKWLAAMGAALSLASLLLQDSHLLLWYPVVVNALLLMLFIASLFSTMPVVERIARITEPVLSAAAIRWTRRVTAVWCLFFIVNGGIALATCLANNLSWWVAWNGALSYLVMALLMAGEWLLRQHFRVKE